MGAEDHAAVFGVVFVGDEEGVLHVAGGMVGGDVEAFEVVVFGFDFGAVGDLEAELGEDFFDFFLDLGKWVNVAYLCGLAWKGGVEEFGFEVFDDLGLFEGLVFFGEVLFEGLFDLVGE